MAIGFGPVDGVQDTIQSNLLNEIDRVRDALSGNGTSHCLDCGEKISLARKKAVPNCCYCVECQKDHDKKPVSYYNRRGCKDSQLR